MKKSFKYWSDLVDKKNRSIYYTNDIESILIYEHTKYTYIIFHNSNVYWCYADEEHKVIYESSHYVKYSQYNLPIRGTYIVLHKYMRPGTI